MTDPRIDLRNPILAAILAYLIPGAGHFYQRRYFKAIIYSVCVLGIFSWGSILAEAKAVHLRLNEDVGKSRFRSLGYLAQVGVGLPALTAVVQRERFLNHGDEQSDRPPGQILEEIDTSFTGNLHHTESGPKKITGQITGLLRVGQYGYSTEFEGHFSGVDEDGQDVEFAVFGSRSGGSLEIGRKITGLDNVTMSQLNPGDVKVEFSANRRRMYCRVVDDDGYSDLGMIEGTIPRSFLDHFQVTLDDESLQYLNGKLGKQYELALVYTWIAGLLNLLAVWDALQGPAYGYGDEEPEQDDRDKKKDKSEKNNVESSDSKKNESESENVQPVATDASTEPVKESEA